METLEFQKQYKNLNPEQKKAVDAIEGAVMVVAGPGTGKTKVLTLRIANILLKTQINPENILALTFTEAAAYEMRKRLLSIIGQNAYRVEITTFHSFCNNFIKRHQEEFAEIISSDSINEIEQIQIVEEVIKKLELEHIKPLGDLTHYVKPTLSAINSLKMENTLPDDLEKALENMEEDLNNREDLVNTKGPYKGEIKSKYKKQFKEIEKNRELAKVYRKYQKKLQENKKYDYSDMLLEVIKKLETHPYLLQYLQEKFQYFLVDEHQDTNRSQNTIVEMMASFFKNPNLFVVGDEKQAIFRFQGASLQNFIYFKNKYPEATLINLSENYRSTQTILDATYSVISNNSSPQIMSESVELVKRSEHVEEKLNLAEFSSYDGEFYWVSDKIKKLLKTTNPNDIAVLVRNNDDLSPLTPILDNEKIPYVIESENDILEDIDIQKMVLLLRSVNDPNNDRYLTKVMLMDCFDINPLDVFKLSRNRYDKGVHIWDLITSKNALKSLEIQDIKPIQSFINLYNGKNGFIKKANNARLDEVFVEVLNKSSLLNEILQKPHAQEILARFARLYDEVQEFVGRDASYSLSDFVKYLDLLEDHNVSLKKNTHVIPEGVIRLMTVHKAKGLEFDHVFVINAYDGHWGNKKNRGARFDIPWSYIGVKIGEEEIDENNDERRLFYVALTRARKNAFITYSNSSQDGREQIASQFVSEIPEDYIDKIDVTSFEKKLRSNLENIFKPVTKNKELSFSKEYVAEVFRKQGLSVSALNNYIECPWKYFFNNLVRVPEKIENAGLFGNAIHESLNLYIISLKKGKADKEFLLEKFKESRFLQSISEGEQERFVKKGEEALEGFYEEKAKHWKSDIESELEIRGIRLNEDISLNGKIDMIEPISKDMKVNVYDFKTGNVKSRNVIEGKTKDSDGNYKRQLVFYKLLLNRYKEGFYKMKHGVIEFVEPNDSGKYKSEVFQIEKDEEKELMDKIKEVSNEIMNLSFWDSRCDEKDCEYCKLRDYIV